MWDKIKAKMPFFLLVCLGYLSVFGYMIQSENIQGLGFISTASPLPLVFSSFRGVEGFTNEFQLEIDGTKEDITPEVYGMLAGPYNRRNVYGAAIAGAPMLTSPDERRMVNAILEYGLCGDGPLIKEFALKPAENFIKIHIKSKTVPSSGNWTIDVNCKDKQT